MKNLKLFILPILALASMMFSSCNNDDETTPEEKTTPEKETISTLKVAGPLSVVVAGEEYSPAENVTYTLTSHPDSTMDVEIPDYTLTGTPMGTLTIGGYKVTGLTIQSLGKLYRDYAKDGLTMKFAMNGNEAKEYNLNVTGAENITATMTKSESDSASVTIVNNFQPEGMPMAIVSTFTTTVEIPD